MELQDVDELVDGDAQAVAAPTGEADQPMAEGGARQGVGHDRLDMSSGILGNSRDESCAR